MPTVGPGAFGNPRPGTLPCAKAGNPGEWSLSGGGHHHECNPGLLQELNVSSAKFLGTGGDVAPGPKIPMILRRRKENSSYGKCAQENCLTRGVHLKKLCPILCPSRSKTIVSGSSERSGRSTVMGCKTNTIANGRNSW